MRVEEADATVISSAWSPKRSLNPPKTKKIWIMKRMSPIDGDVVSQTGIVSSALPLVDGSPRKADHSNGGSAFKA